MQYTRNTVTGSSTADVVVLLVDARKGVVEQTRRHLAVTALLRVPHVVVAVNKIDLVDDAESVFAQVSRDVRAVAEQLGIADAHAVPVSALLGDNIVEPSANTPWYTGPSLLGLLETLSPSAEADEEPFRFTVQLAIRPQGAAREPQHLDYRGYAGQVTSGVITPGTAVVALPSGQRTTVVAIDLGEAGLDEAAAGRSVTLRLSDDVDLSRGDTLVAADDVPVLTQDVTGVLCWLGDTELRPGARVLVKHRSRTVPAIVRSIEGRLDLDTLATEPSDRLRLNDIGQVVLRTASALPIEDSAAQPGGRGLPRHRPCRRHTVAAGWRGHHEPAPGRSTSATGGGDGRRRTGAGRRSARLSDEGGKGARRRTVGVRDVAEAVATTGAVEWVRRELRGPADLDGAGWCTPRGRHGGGHRSPRGRRHPPRVVLDATDASATGQRARRTDVTTLTASSLVAVHAGGDPRLAASVRDGVDLRCAAGGIDLRRRRPRPQGGSPWSGADPAATAAHDRGHELRGLGGRRRVVDRLAPRGVVSRLPASVRVIDVGKTRTTTGPEDRINAILVEEASAASVSSALKGGDPYVLGPGVRSACVEAHGYRRGRPGGDERDRGPAAAGIPVTHRGSRSRSRWSPSRVRSRHSHGSDHTWCSQGVSMLRQIALELIARDAGACPVAVIERGFLRSSA